MPATTTEPTVDWRNRVGTAGLLIGSAMVGLDKVLFPERRKADSEQVTSEPLGEWPHLDLAAPNWISSAPIILNGYWPG